MIKDLLGLNLSLDPHEKHQIYTPTSHLIDLIILSPKNKAISETTTDLLLSQLDLLQPGESHYFKESWKKRIDTPESILEKLIEVNKRSNIFEKEAFDIIYLRFDPHHRIDHISHRGPSLVTWQENTLKMEGRVLLQVNPKRVNPLLFVKKSTTLLQNMGQLNLVRQFVDDAHDLLLNVSQPEILQIKLLLHEAFSNIVKHGVEGEAIRIEIERVDDELILNLYDQTQGFDPTACPFPHFNGERSGGFGIYLMKQIACRISYQKKLNNKGFNCLTLYKSLKNLKDNKMEISQIKKENQLIITLKGDVLDAHVSSDIRSQLKKIIESAEEKKITLDLINVHFLDSSGFGSLLTLSKLAKAHNREFVLTNLSSHVEKMFHMLNLDKLITLIKPTNQKVS